MKESAQESGPQVESIINGLLTKGPDEILLFAQTLVLKEDMESLVKVHALVRRAFLDGAIHSDANALEKLYRAIVQFCTWFGYGEDVKWAEALPLVGRWEEIGELSRQFAESMVA